MMDEMEVPGNPGYRWLQPGDPFTDKARWYDECSDVLQTGHEAVKGAVGLYKIDQHILRGIHYRRDRPWPSNAHGLCGIVVPVPLRMFEILVPTIRRIAGTPYRTRFHQLWDGKVREIAGGLTILSPVKGQWVSPGDDLFEERMIPVRIACTKAQIEAIADMTAAYYDQLAVMYYQIADEVVVKHYAVED